MGKSTRFRLLMNCWPPFLLAGIHVLRVSADFREVSVRLTRRWYNRNYVGTHFGGSLFAMTDPYWMIMVMENLGRDYIVWDRRAEIEFVKAVREPVYAHFRLTGTDIDELRARVHAEGKTLHWFEIDVGTASGDLVARVRKQIYLRLKKRD